MADKVAVVTGGGAGIGREIVGALVGAGYRVGFSHVGEAAAARAVEEDAGARGGDCIGIEADAGDPRAVEAFFDAVAARFGVPELLVNNAGVQTWSSLLDLRDDDWDRVIRTNLSGCFYNTSRFARRRVAAGGRGAVVNIGSGCNKIAFPSLVDYTASKGGVEQFTKVAAVELGPHGITVNCVAPGAIETERTLAEAGDYGTTWAPVTPLRRVGTPKDVAEVVLFLASPAAAFVTGQTIWVDGGLFSRPVWPYGG